MATTRSVYLEDEDDKIVQNVAADRQWSVSKVIAEMVRSSPLYRDETTKPAKRNRPKAVTA